MSELRKKYYLYTPQNMKMVMFYNNFFLSWDWDDFSGQLTLWNKWKFIHYDERKYM